MSDGPRVEDAIQIAQNALRRMSELEDRVDGLEAENGELRTRLDKLGDIGQQKTSKEQKVAAIVTYADNQRSAGQSAVTVLPRVIKGLVGVSRRYAYDLVDDMVEEYEWAYDPQKVNVHPGHDGAKGVLIDFDGIHGEPVSVNKFTTAAARVGVAD